MLLGNLSTYSLSTSSQWLAAILRCLFPSSEKALLSLALVSCWFLVTFVKELQLKVALVELRTLNILTLLPDDYSSLYPAWVVVFRKASGKCS